VKIYENTKKGKEKDKRNRIAKRNQTASVAGWEENT
jgi:hypothetical protein